MRYAGPDPTPVLYEGLRAIDGLPGVVLGGSPTWLGDRRVWRVDLRLRPAALGSTRPIRATTTWVMLVEDAYPFGSIDFYPALDGGIQETFPHQLNNRPGPGWRSGKICQGMNDAILGRLAAVEEPRAASLRLRWHVERAMAWILAASNDELARPGDPFELPDFSPRTGLLAYSESSASFTAWQDDELPRFGYVDVVNLAARDRRAPPKRYIGAFRDGKGKAVKPSPWGTYLTEDFPDPKQGPWILLPAVPIIEPWQALRTWADLREACRQAGMDLDEILRSLTVDLRRREGKKHRPKFEAARAGVVGFPISRILGESPAFIHWQGFWFPELTEIGTKTNRGFRPTPSNAWANDRRSVFADQEDITWMRSENWDIEQVSSRGALAPAARERRVAFIGAGTLASILSETLVRLGVRDAVIVDHDDLHGGNLVRHTLTMADVEEAKATSLARRLNAAHPAVRAFGVTSDFPSLSDEDQRRLLDCDVVVDTTGSDDVLQALATFPWTDAVTFLSLSLAADAEKLFAFAGWGESFPADEFWRWFEPIAEAERLRVGPNPMEGAGCWWPVMPARWDRILALVGRTTPWVEARMLAAALTSRWVVVDLPEPLP